MKGTSVLDTLGEEKKTQMEQVYYNPVRDDATGAVYCKIVNASEKEKQLTICDETGKPYQVERVWLLAEWKKKLLIPWRSRIGWQSGRWNRKPGKKEG